MNFQMYKTNRNKLIEFRKTKKWLLINYLVSLLVWLFLFLFCYFFQNFKFQIPTEQYLFQIVSAAICGLCLPFSGSSLQYLTRNELAGPTTLGFLPLTTTSLIIYLFIDKASQDGIGVYFQYIITFVLSILLIAIIYLNKKQNVSDFNGINDRYTYWCDKFIINLFISKLFHFLFVNTWKYANFVWLN